MKRQLRIWVMTEIWWTQAILFEIRKMSLGYGDNNSPYLWAIEKETFIQKARLIRIASTNWGIKELDNSTNKTILGKMAITEIDDVYMAHINLAHCMRVFKIAHFKAPDGNAHYHNASIVLEEPCAWCINTVGV